MLTCSPEFPAEANGGLAFLESVAELQTTVAAYVRETLVVLFHSTSHDAASFLSMWKEQGKLQPSESRSEAEIDAAVRTLVNILLRETQLLGEEELRSAIKNENLPEMLYYLSTLQGSLS